MSKNVKILILILLVIILILWFVPLIPKYRQAVCIKAPCNTGFDGYITLKEFLF
jgi:hypothetical protein